MDMAETNECSTNKTPPDFEMLEPDFTNKSACLPEDFHNDWLSNLVTENKRRIDEAKEWDHAFLTSRSAEYIFTICTRLRLPQGVKYSALLIFDKFMIQLVIHLHEIVSNSNRSDRKKFREWHRIEATLSRQTTLRMLSAIQIASKMNSYEHSLSIKTVQLCLKTLGFAYTEEAIMRSELRVLSMINWKPAHHSTPLVYTESLFKILKMRWNRDINVESYWQYILLVLDCVFILWNDVYKRMMANVMGPAASNVTREQLCRVQADWFLLACGVIVTAACCIEGIQVADEVANELHRLSNIPIADVTDMSVAIIECVASSEQPTTAPINMET